MLCLFVFGCISGLYKDNAQTRHALYENLYVQLVRDVVRRDLLGAGSDVRDYALHHNLFKKCWLDQRGRQQSAWIGYQATDKGLARFQGIYNPKTHTWSKRTVSYLPAYFEQISFALELDQQLQQPKFVTVTYGVQHAGHQKKVTDYCLVKNGLFK